MNAGQPVRTPTTVKHMMEAFGVPHAKVDMILANGESAGFNRILREGDRVIWPNFEAFDVRPLEEIHHTKIPLEIFIPHIDHRAESTLR
jgi:hypothetical protein